MVFLAMVLSVVSPPEAGNKWGRKVISIYSSTHEWPFQNACSVLGEIGTVVFQTLDLTGFGAMRGWRE